MLRARRPRGAPDLAVSSGRRAPASAGLFRYSRKSQVARAGIRRRDQVRELLTRNPMLTPQRYTSNAPTRAEVEALTGATVIEFGANWCGICAGAQPSIVASLAAHPEVRHLKIEDGPGRPLGRSFGVKLWPTLVFLRDGIEVARVVRPIDARQIEAEGFAALA